MRTPQEADELIAAAKKTGAKIAIAHRNRYHPALEMADLALWDEPGTSLR
jgi:predicted dehydrogenase